MYFCDEDFIIVNLDPHVEAVRANNSGDYKTVFQICLSKIKMLQSDDITDAVYYLLSTPAYVQIQEMMLRPIGQKTWYIYLIKKSRRPLIKRISMAQGSSR